MSLQSFFVLARQKFVENRHILLGVVLMTFSLFLAGTKNILAQTNDVDPGSKETCTVRPVCLSNDPPCDIKEPAGGWCPATVKETCTVKPACMYETPACAVDPAPGFTGWCPDASPLSTIRPMPSPSDSAKEGKNQCTVRPACLDAAKPCDIREPAAGWCPASPSPSIAPNTCPADLNKDGFIDLIDYGMFVPHFLETTATSKNDAPIVGDFNNDGIVDLLDYSEIVRMFLKECPASGNTGKLGSPQPLGSPGIEVQPTASPDNILPIN